MTKKMPELSVKVLEEGQKNRGNWKPCYIHKNLKFNVNILKKYFFVNWDSKLYDLLLLAAAVEYCDKIRMRHETGWGRKFNLKIPVHTLDVWNQKEILNSLESCLNLLTGDIWNISFYQRKKEEPWGKDKKLSFPPSAHSIIAYSDGMDSRCVGVIYKKTLNKNLIRVRVGNKKDDKYENRKEPFTSIPYRVITNITNNESSARSRGFKFATISAMTAYLADAKEIIIPESGQGSLGSTLIPVGHVYPDYRNHPEFTYQMKEFIRNILNYDLKYVFPRIWFTKGQTLEKALEINSNEFWQRTWSCWQGSRHASLNGKKRQCGICAACLLRRLSVHAAKQSENDDDLYMWPNLKAVSFEKGAHPDLERATLKRIAPAQKKYAIAGVLHLDHLADLYTNPVYKSSLERYAGLIADYLPSSPEETHKNLQGMLKKHSNEWSEFLVHLKEESFISQLSQHKK